MRIVLFRHGPAETRDGARWPDDLKRPLTERGIKRTRRSARGIARMEPGATLVLSSPATRALDSARLLAEAYGIESEPELLPSLAPGGARREILVRLSRESADTTLALVGHEPDLGDLASTLLFSNAGQALAFKKAGACAIDCDAPEPGGGRLKWWLTPGALRALRPSRKGRVT